MDWEFLEFICNRIEKIEKMSYRQEMRLLNPSHDFIGEQGNSEEMPTLEDFKVFLVDDVDDTSVDCDKTQNDYHVLPRQQGQITLEDVD